MFNMYASNSHSYTHLILALGIVREPTVWVFITSKYSGIHDITLGHSFEGSDRDLGTYEQGARARDVKGTAWGRKKARLPARLRK